jgi:hypothetical protein
MRVKVDKAGRDNAARSIQNAVGSFLFQSADLRDFAVLDRKVTHIAWRTRPINDSAALDDDVKIRHGWLRHEAS